MRSSSEKCNQYKVSLMSYKPNLAEDFAFSDLHCHSYCSDGELSPRQLVERAASKGVRILALTDHDTTDGVAEAEVASQEHALKLIPGVELTALWGKRVVHIVGLGFDPDNLVLKDYLRELKQLRDRRAELIAARLVKKGCPDLLDKAKALAGEGQIGRPHFAQAMVAARVVDSPAKAFSLYLGAGKPGDIKVEWPEMSAAIECLHQAGGYAVLAHPTKYKLTFTKIREMIAAFAESGGDAIEARYPGIDPGQTRQIEIAAQRHNLSLSAGSDFHCTGFSWSELGKYPKISDSDMHILHQIL